ncbi:protoglobin domain-containing protein [Photobacterium alginatilyticum]
MMKYVVIWLYTTALLFSVEVLAAKEIPGYAYGDKQLATAPYTLKDLEALKATVLFTDKDAKWLRISRKVLEPHAEEILDTWYGFVGSTPHLLHYFSNDKGKVDSNYLARVRARFIQWIYDTADAKYDQSWLDYQYEIGIRHHRLGKNKTDNAKAVEHIPFRYVVALTYPVTATLKPFLERSTYSPEEVNAMHQAWIKSVLMQTILWSYPYTKQGDF